MKLQLVWCFIAIARTSMGLKLQEANPNVTRLHDDLLSNYSRLIRPVTNVSDISTARLGLKLSQHKEMTLKKQVMTTNLWVEQVDMAQPTAKVEDCRYYEIPFFGTTFKLTMKWVTLFFAVNMIIELSIWVVFMFYLTSVSDEKIPLCDAVLMSLTMLLVLGMADIMALETLVLGKILLYIIMPASLGVSILRNRKIQREFLV